MLNLDQIRHHFTKYDALCNHLGIDIVEVDENHSVSLMPIDERHLNGMGSTHGAVLFAQIDVTFAALSNASGLYCTNAQTNVSFLAATKSGPLRCEAKVIHRGKKLGTYEVRIHDAQSKLVAVATITGYFTGMPLPLDAA